MDFLPIEINNEKVYAGFWRRFCAAIIDTLILVIFVLVFDFIEITSLLSEIISLVISSLLFSAYTILFHYKFGATLGKMTVGIRVTLPNGEKIGFKHATLRSSVDLVFVVFITVAQIIAISNADSEIFLNGNLLERAEYILPLFPVWYGFVNLANQLWYWGEFFVLLFNKRKRAIHDFIAGTIVIHQEYAEQGTQQESTNASPVS